MNLLHILFMLYTFKPLLSISPASLLPSSSVLYPLDFQDTWQASEPIPIVINYSISEFGPNDEISYKSETNNL